MRRRCLRALAALAIIYFVIEIYLNGEAHHVADEVVLPELLRHFVIAEKRVAIELNGRVVSRTDWPKTIVGNGDKIEVVHFVGGG